MTPTEALELSKQFPENRTVPRRIANAMKKQGVMIEKNMNKLLRDCMLTVFL